jgi:hypothetical protein
LVSLLAVEVGLAQAGSGNASLVVCMAATVKPEPRVAVSWRAPHYASGQVIDWVRTNPPLVCARVAGAGLARTRGLFVWPAQN